MDVDDFVGRLQAALAREQQTVERRIADLGQLVAALGDVTVDDHGEPRTGRLDCADGVRFDVHRGTCDGHFDAPAAIYATPFVRVGEREVLARGDFWIGERVGDARSARPGWETEMQEAGVPPRVVALCTRYLEGAKGD